MKTIKVTIWPEPDPLIVRSVTDYVNHAYQTEIVAQSSRIGTRVRVASIAANVSLRPYFLKDGTIMDLVFVVHDEDQLQFLVKLDDGNIIQMSSAEFVTLQPLPPNPIPAEVPMNDKGWLPGWMSRSLGLEESLIGKHVRVIKADRFPGKYLEEGTVSQVFTAGSVQTFNIQLFSGELLKDVLDSEVRFL